MMSKKIIYILFCGFILCLQKTVNAETVQKHIVSIDSQKNLVNKAKEITHEERNKKEEARKEAQKKDTVVDSQEVDPKKSLERQAEDFIQDLGDKAIKNLTGKELTREERNKKFEGMFVRAFDYEKIGKFVLGRYRRDAKPDEMKEYIQLFKSTIVQTYAARFGEYQEEKFKVTSNKKVDKDVATIIVSSQIIRPNDTKISIEWHLYKDKEDEFKIFDVVVEGVSMALTQRSEFNAILQKEGSLHGLNEVLRKRQG